MQCVLMIGIPATGKSTFCRERFFYSHVRINLDMLKTRHREKLLFQACLTGQQSMVIDNTNVTKAQRARYITPAREADFEIVGYYFQSKVSDALVRNGERDTTQQIPDKGIYGLAGQLEYPQYDEGFDTLYYVSIGNDGNFEVKDWSDG